MSIVKVELLPEFFRGMAMHPTDAALDRIGRTAVAREGVGRFLWRHGGQRNHASVGLILAHRTMTLFLMPTLVKSALYLPSEPGARSAPLTSSRTRRYTLYASP